MLRTLTLMTCLVVSVTWSIGIAEAVTDAEMAAGIWLFDDGSGDTAWDSSPNSNHGELRGGPEWGQGRFGGALIFDGADDYVAVEDSDSLDAVGEALTLMAWVNGDGWPSGWNHILRKTTPDSPTPYFYILGVHSTGLPFMHLKTDAGEFYDIQGTDALATNQWIHLAMVYDGAMLMLYVDGEIAVEAPAQGALEANEGELRIGLGNPAGYFRGGIDEAAVWQSALSQAEIREIMDSGLVTSVLPVQARAKLLLTWAHLRQW